MTTQLLVRCAHRITPKNAEFIKKYAKKNKNKSEAEALREILDNAEKVKIKLL